MLDREAALSAAAAYLAEESRDWPADHAARTIPEQAFADGSGLIVPYNSVMFLESRDKNYALAGNCPILVDTVTGECRELDLDEVIAYRRRGFAV
ncbi:hypothetical protein ACQP2P_11775 [Dactylosporangium sp. CA-139114]|uniref:hypothetical protein n=1 Tax=Dactylosporangium sp. CA-139114 TaxID=3239931 RepID=UPI003D953E77